MKTKSFLAIFAIIAMTIAIGVSTTSAKWGAYNTSTTSTTCTVDDDGDGIPNAYDSDYVRTPKLDGTGKKLRGNR